MIGQSVRPGQVIKEGVIARNEAQTIYVTQNKRHGLRYWRRNHDGTYYVETDLRSASHDQMNLVDMEVSQCDVSSRP